MTGPQLGVIVIEKRVEQLRDVLDERLIVVGSRRSVDHHGADAVEHKEQ